MAVTRRGWGSGGQTPAQFSMVPMPPSTRSSAGPEPAVSKPMGTPSGLVIELLVPCTAGSLGPGVQAQDRGGGGGVLLLGDVVTGVDGAELDQVGEVALVLGPGAG